jgi:mRNA-degrading endonuclease RelE of RelBE toxin-antitoxin system
MAPFGVRRAPAAPFSIQYGQDAQNALKRMERPQAGRILEKIEVAATNPDHFFSQLVGSDLFRLRVGAWRVLTEIHWEEKVIFVRSIGKRENVYERP